MNIYKRCLFVVAAVAAVLGGAAVPAAPMSHAAADLRLGEYACYGYDGQVMIGLGFKVPASGRYSDLDGTQFGTYTVAGNTVTFSGGHLDGQQGRDFDADNASFAIGGAQCEPW